MNQESRSAIIISASSDIGLSLRQEAAVALKKHRNRMNNPDDEVIAIGKEVGQGKKKTEIDVETRTEQLEVKGGDYSNRSSLKKDENTATGRIKRLPGTTDSGNPADWLWLAEGSVQASVARD
jgi:hypothetical protein